MYALRVSPTSSIIIHPGDMIPALTGPVFFGAPRTAQSMSVAPDSCRATLTDMAARDGKPWHLIPISNDRGKGMPRLDALSARTLDSCFSSIPFPLKCQPYIKMDFEVIGAAMLAVRLASTTPRYVQLR